MVENLANWEAKPCEAVHIQILDTLWLATQNTSKTIGAVCDLSFNPYPQKHWHKTTLCFWLKAMPYLYDETFRLPVANKLDRCAFDVYLFTYWLSSSNYSYFHRKIFKNLSLYLIYFECPTIVKEPPIHLKHSSNFSLSTESTIIFV